MPSPPPFLLLLLLPVTMSTSSTPQSGLQTQTHYYSHHTRTRFIPHRVHDSLHRRFIKLLCSVFLSLLLASAFLLFLLFLILRPHRPRFHVSSLSFHLHGAASFNVSLRNPNREIGIYYDSMSGSVFYKSNELAVFDRVTPPFYQPPKNTKVVLGTAAVAVDDVVAEETEADLAAGGSVGLRLELRSTVRFRVRVWDTHRHRMHVSCNLEVGPDGNLLREYKDKRCSIYFL